MPPIEDMPKREKGPANENSCTNNRDNINGKHCPPLTPLLKKDRRVSANNRRINVLVSYATPQIASKKRLGITTNDKILFSLSRPTHVRRPYAVQVRRPNAVEVRRPYAVRT